MPETENEALLNWIDDREDLHELAPGKIYGTLRDGKLTVTDTNDYRHAPVKQKREVTFLDPGSFLDYWAYWANDECQPEAWVDPNTRTVTAIFDATTLDDPTAIGWAGHRAVLRPEKTPDWIAWVKMSGELMRQETFAEFIEDHLPQIVEPAGAVMLEVAQSLQGTVKAEWKQAVRLSDGQVGLQYVEAANASAGAKGSLPIPAEFTIAVAPFKGGSPYKVRARFRYRIAGDQIALGFKLDRALDVEDAAWDDLLSDLRSGLDEQSVKAYLRTGRPS